MIYIIGDTHGAFENIKALVDSENLSKQDKIIVAGDFGFYFFDNEKEKYRRQMLRFFTNADILFLDGNHENFKMLSKLPKKEMFDSIVGYDYSTNFIHLLRGNKYIIENKTFFTFGGGHSIDKSLRKNGVSHWEEEIPSIVDIKNANNTLLENDTYDFVLTHVAPFSLLQPMYDAKYLDKTKIEKNPYLKLDTQVEEMVEEFKNKLKFKNWIFGHYHVDCSLFGKFHCLGYNTYAKIDSATDNIEIKTFKNMLTKY